MSDNDPPERDVKDFEFLQLCKFRVSPSDSEVSTSRQQLLACSSQYGVLVYATKQGFSVVKTSELLSIDSTLGKERTKTLVTDIPVECNVVLNSTLIMMEVSSDGKTLAVVVREMGQLDILLYDVQGFFDKNSSSQPFTQTRLPAPPSTTVVSLAWNPAFVSLASVCLSDGSVLLLDVTDKVVAVGSLPAAIGATCFCWSPKGKQLLVGKKDGSFTQYDHSMAEKKHWPCPNVLNGAFSAVDVVWQGTYVFTAAYLQVGAQPSDQPCVVMTTSNKENNTSYLNFDDVCFGNGENRKAQYYFHFVQKWDLVLMSSSNATETTIVGKNLDNKTTWDHWNLEDTARAELPLTEDKNDSYPIGMAVDYSPQGQVVLGEARQFPPCPVMYLLSTDGVLMAYHLAYFHKDVLSLVTPLVTPALAPNLAEVRRPAPGAPQLAKPAAPMAQLAPLAPAPGNPQTQTGTVNPIASMALGPSFQFAGLASKSPATAPTTQKPGSLFTSLSAAPESSSSQKSLFPSMSANQPAASTPKVGQGQGGLPAQSIFGQPKSSATGFAFGSAATPSQSSAFSFVPSSSSGSTPPPAAKPASIFGGSLPKPGIPPTQPTPPSSLAQGTNAASPAAPPPASLFGGQPKPAMGSMFGTPQKPEAAKADAPQAKVQPGFGGITGVNPLAGSSAFSLQPTAQSQGQGQAPSVVPAKPTGLPQPTMGSFPTTRQDPPVQPSIEQQQSIEAKVDDAFTQNILEEMKDFESEMQGFRHRSKRAVQSVGTREEIQGLRQDAERCTHFLNDIKDTTKDQSKESQDQKSLLLNLFAMAEECRTKQERDADPHYHSLLQGRTLDPASAEKLKSLQQACQAVETCVVEVDTLLDNKWTEHLDQRKVKERMHTPTGDTIYKTLRNNNMLITSQRRQLEKLEQQLRNIKLYTTPGKADNDNVADTMASSMSPLTPRGDVGRAEKTLTSAVSEGMTPEKISRLREVLTHRKVPTIKSMSPANLSKSRIVSLTPKTGPRTPVGATQSPLAAPPAPAQTPVGVSAVPLRIQKGLPQMPSPSPPVPPSPIPVVAPAPMPFTPSPSTFGQGQVKVTQGVTPGGVTLGGVTPGVVGSGNNSFTGRPATSFSGVAFFKQPSQAPSPLSQQVPVSVVEKPPTPAAPAVQDPTDNYYPQPVYEDVTPTETDETYDEDDYDDDDEDNGYDEEDEDEEETGFLGIEGGTQGLSPMHRPSDDTGPGGLFKAAPSSFGGTSGGQAFTPVKSFDPVSPRESPAVIQKPAAPKDLFGSKSSTDKAASSAAGFSFAVPSSKETSVADEANPGKFAFGGSGTAATTGFSFGAPTAFGQKLGSKEGQGAGEVFGAMATPSKNKGFADLLKDDETTEALEGESSKETKTGVPDKPAPSSFGSVSSAGASSSLFGAKPTIGGGDSLFGGKPSGDSAPGLFGAKPSSTGDSAPAPSLFGGSGATTAPGKGRFSFSVTPGSASDSQPPPDSGAGGDGPATPTPVSAPVATLPVSSTSESPSESKPQDLSTPPNVVDSSQNIKIEASTPGSFGTPGSLFGTSAISTTSSAATSSSAGLFGATSTSGTTSLFGNAGASSTAAKSLFGGSSAPSDGKTTTPSLFGGAASTEAETSTASSLFGGNPAASSTTGSLFGGAPATTSSAVKSLFGGSSVASTTPTEAGTTAATANKSPLFGGGISSTAASSTPSLFGGSQTPASGSAPLFGAQAATTSSTSAFGGFGSTTGVGSTTSSTPLFGQSSSSSPAPTPFGFGTPASSGAAPLFGSSTTPASSSGSTGMFGSSGTSGSMFGNTAANESSAAKPGGLFGNTASTGGSLFGGSTTTAAPVPGFGQAPASPAASGFGFGQSTGQTSGFGQTTSASSGSGSLFGGGGGGGGSGGGGGGGFGGFGGLGGKPSEEKANTNVFGVPQTFGDSGANTSQGLFGSGGGSSTFGGGSGGGSTAFGGGAGSPSGTFSTGAQGVAAAGFGTMAPGNTAAAGFGGSPAFGGSPSFGSTGSGFGAKPGFGASPSFGGGSSFGGGNTASSFGNTGSSFGSSTAPGVGGGSGFSGFANAAAPSFGQLATNSSSTGQGSAGFGAPQAPASPFGAGGGGFASPGGFGGGGGGGSVFGQTAASPSAGFGQTAASPSAGFGGGGQSPGFGNSQPASFGGTPSFTSYRG